MDFSDLDCWKLLTGKIQDEISWLEYDHFEKPALLCVYICLDFGCNHGKTPVYYPTDLGKLWHPQLNLTINHAERKTSLLRVGQLSTIYPDILLPQICGSHMLGWWVSPENTDETTKSQAQLDSMVPALRGLSDLEHRHGALEVVNICMVN